MKIQISGKARSEPLRAYRYLADRNPVAAENFVSDVNLKLDQSSRFPYIGRERTEFAPNLRSILVRTFVLFYVSRDDRIEIVRVIDGRMDIHQELQR